eukprot:CAMPEP_0197582052 /NCGR_PEP_ID=MMETSP1326-20131121/5379_1 /TAXON_ID=1155430 /ORGANISM="Genus nov. species nov., Strain RCC2288" /LENGTH=171 /DNA_ID=CAMNT_0043146063 /DNA_START=110 /DNA_END=621 /DNA_ORIENTATION=+
MSDDGRGGRDNDYGRDGGGGGGGGDTRRGGGGGGGAKREDGVSLLIRNLPRDATADDVMNAFSKFGTVSDCYIPKDYYTKNPKGFAFIQFPDPREAEDAERGLDRTMMMGNEVTVQVALQKRKDPSFYRENRGRDPNGGGGGYGGGGGGGDYRGRDSNDRGGGGGGGYSDR